MKAESWLGPEKCLLNLWANTSFYIFIFCESYTTPEIRQSTAVLTALSASATSVSVFVVRLKAGDELGGRPYLSVGLMATDHTLSNMAIVALGELEVKVQI